MKNSLKFSALLVLILAFTSCKKEYTCVCTAETGESTSVTIEAVSKSQATTVCEGLEIDNFLGISTSCRVF